jgi:hypothetical protein
MIRITADQEKDLYEPACGPVDIDWKHLRRGAPGAACTFFTTACFYSPRALVQLPNNVSTLSELLRKNGCAQ